MAEIPSICPVCSSALPPDATRRRVYCSDRCRVAAARSRKTLARLEAELLPITGAVPGWARASAAPSEPARAPAHPDEQAARAVLEARALSGAFRRLGREARREIRWRCSKVAEGLELLLETYFGDVG